MENLDPKKQIMPGDLDRLERDFRQLHFKLDTIMESSDLHNEKVLKDVNDQKRSAMEIEEDLKLVLMLLKGNELDKGDSGIVGQIHRLQDELEKLEKWTSDKILKLEKIRDKVIWMTAGFSFAIGVLVTVLTYVIKFWPK